MSDQDFKERLSKLKAKWEEGTADPDSMTAEAKRQCLEELDWVCRSLKSMRDGLAEASKADMEAEEKIKVQKTVDGYLTRLKEIRGEMKSIGVVGIAVNYGCHFPIYGYLPTHWVDRTEYLAKIKSAKHQLEMLEGELSEWMPAITDYKKDCNGFLVDFKIVLPPPTKNLEYIHGNIRNDGAYSQHIRGKISELNPKAFQLRRELQGLLLNHKPVDLKKIQGNLDKLNKEREEIIYNLRVLEGNGHSTGFDPKDFALD